MDSGGGSVVVDRVLNVRDRRIAGNQAAVSPMALAAAMDFSLAALGRRGQSFSRTWTSTRRRQRQVRISRDPRAAQMEFLFPRRCQPDIQRIADYVGTVTEDV